MDGGTYWGPELAAGRRTADPLGCHKRDAAASSEFDHRARDSLRTRGKGIPFAVAAGTLVGTA